VEHFASRVVEDLLGRVDGPMAFRLILQPAMAICLAIRDGRRDARQARAPYSWAMLSSPDHRRDLLREGWKATGRVYLLAIALDVVYQLLVFGFVYPLESLVVALLLAFVPYLLTRGPVNRLSRRGGGAA